MGTTERRSTWRERHQRTWTIREAEDHALAEHPDCTEAYATNGMNCFFEMTWVVNLWRTRECRNAGDPPRYIVEGYTAELGRPENRA